MHPIAFHIFGRPIHWYGIAVATGFILAIMNWSYLARKSGYSKHQGADMGFWIMVCSIVGARMAYVLSDLPRYMDDPMSIIRIDQGGLVFFGGLIGGTLAVIIYALYQKMPMFMMGDVAVVGLVMGHILGRIGCFMNGCCHGSPSDVPWAVQFPAKPPDDPISVHPTQLYESTLNFFLWILLFWYFHRKKKHGAVVALYLMIYPVGRFLLEMVRGDKGERVSFFGLSSAQNLSIVLVLVGIALWIWLPNRLDTPPSRQPKQRQEA